MEQMQEQSDIRFNFKSNKPSIIKVIGVGGGGGNAVNHMYKEGIHDVSFLLCNTDYQALSDSPIPTRLQLGSEGLGAGNRPERARQAANESIEDIKRMLDDGTRMVFITAGMGGGTGTGAAPVIAQCAKDMGILTVGIVTIPFLFEGHRKINQALDGVEDIAQHVDALLVINNERLREIYPELTVLNAFSKADDTLSVAARSIAEIITVHGIVNMDFQDVTTVLKDGGVAIMSMGYGEGEGRVTQAIQGALHSPLLNNNDIYNAKKVLLNICFSSENEENQLTMEEMSQVHEFMSRFGEDFETKWGMAIDPTLDKKVKITILATGFGLRSVTGKEVDEEKRTVTVERIGKYYGSSDQPTRRPHHLYTFTGDDLDNDAVISMVEELPTYKRSRELLLSIKNKAAAAAQNAPVEMTQTDDNKIVFNVTE